MKYLFTIMMAAYFSVAAFGQTEKTVIKSIPIETAAVATFELPGEAVVTEWDKDYIRVSATITVMNTTENILKRLVVVGRYEIQATEVNGELTIHMPKMMHHIAIKGEDLIEEIRFEISAPESFPVKTIYPDYYEAVEMM